MRLSKRIAAVALAAVMAVSMLTACGGGGGSSTGGSNNGGGNGGNNSSIGGNINGGNGNNNGGSGNNGSNGNGGNGSNNGNGGTGTGGSGNNGSGSNDGNVINGIVTEVSNPKNQAYAGSRTAKTLGSKEYTAEYKADFGDFTEETGNFETMILISTDGTRTYSKSDAMLLGFSYSEIRLEDESVKKQWVIDPEDGTYTEEALDSTDDATDDIEPIEGMGMKKGTYTVNGVSYYAESQSYAVVEDGVRMTMTVIYCFNGNTPKYMIGVISDGDSTAMEAMRFEFKNFTTKADSSLLDFESILKNYKPAKAS